MFRGTRSGLQRSAIEQPECCDQENHERSLRGHVSEGNGKPGESETHKPGSSDGLL